MKINEKNLCAYAVSSTSTVDKQGYLMKKGEVNKGFQKRWFVLKGNLLFYFEKRFDKEPLGVIILEGCTIELDENDAKFSFKIVFHGMGNRSYVLCAESQESMEQWMKSLACASYDYMKLMVTDLQRQLKETRNNVCGKSADSACANSALTENSSVFQDTHSEEKFNNFNLNSMDSHPNVTISPHPPPRNRQNLRHRIQVQGHATTSSQVNYGNLSETDAINSHPNSTQVLSSDNRSSSYLTFPNPRNKIIFKDIHTAYGRPVLRDRNEWRYKKRDNDNVGSVTTSANRMDPHHFRQQNLLISL